MRRRAVLSSGAALVVAAGAGAGWWLRSAPAAPAAASRVPTGSVTVTRTDLSTTATVSGTLGYTGAYRVYSPAGGTITWLPQPGQVITRGRPVLAIDNKTVRLFYGATPAWRSLSVGVADGPDVRALEGNLKALGYADGLIVDGHFTHATAAALRRWQHATHQPVTGRLDLGAVTFQPGKMRVTALGAQVGAPAGGGAPLVTGTSTTVAVTLAIPVTDAHAVHSGDAVTVIMPTGQSVPGRVTQLSTVAAQPNPEDQGRGSQLPTVGAIVTLAREVAGAGLDQAPVEVHVTDASVKNALVVPITALVALAGGGYGLYLLDGGARRLVGVTAGLFSDTQVEVKGNDLRDGSKVEVPAS
jgi:peptidoglycan hydrolase-like protein with peptidoglycan-binding domain